jgi:2-methylcitrate dehydratase PrpD
MNPATWFGGMGVVAAGAKLLKLTADETQNALSIAASHCCGIGKQSGYDAHFIESGHTSRSGLMSAILAKAGATGDPNKLDDPKALYGPVFFEGQVNLDIITANLGKPPWSIHQAQVKKYSACILSHSSVDALTLLVKENSILYDDVEQVETAVSKSARNSVDRYLPVTLLAARFSLQYLLGEVLLRGNVDVATFAGEEKLTEERHKEAQGKIKVVDYPDVHHDYEGATVTVTMKDGRKLVKHLDAGIGSPDSPLTLEEIRDISRPYLDEMLAEPERDRVEQLMLNLEKQPDILELMDILSFARVGPR